MRLETFLLADAATASPDGKLYIHGGGITRLNAPALPLVTGLAVIARFSLTSEDLGSEHTLTISLSDPDGEILLAPAPLHVPAAEAPTLPEGEERFLQMVLAMGAVGFPRAGAYTFELTVDGRVVKRMTMPVLSVDELESETSRSASAESSRTSTTKRPTTPPGKRGETAAE